MDWEDVGRVAGKAWRGLGDLLTGNDKIRAGLKGQERAIAQARAEASPFYGQAIESYQPYTGLASMLTDARSRLMSGAYNPSYSQFTADPSYQFAMEEAMRAGQRGLSSMGLMGSGRGGRELARYASGLAGQQYDKFYQRGQDQFRNEMGLGQLGMGAIQGQNQARLGFGDFLGNLAIGRGQARADAYGARGANQRALTGDILGMAGKGITAYLTGGT